MTSRLYDYYICYAEKYRRYAEEYRSCAEKNPGYRIQYLEQADRYDKYAARCEARASEYAMSETMRLRVL